MNKINDKIEDDTIELIYKIANRVAGTFKFGIYDKEDLVQEAVIFGLNCLSNYDKTRPLENFLFVHITNRLITFRRNNFYRKFNCDLCKNEDPDCEKCLKRNRYIERKKNIIKPIDLDNVNDEHEKNMWNSSLIEDISTQEILDKIDKELPIGYREDYIKMKTGNKVPKSRRLEVEKVILNILKDSI
jgi:DNA-directed RNA polymerase specialized sigma24 family protein